jgi:DNA-binding HxlR family transcriptional regulator
MDLSPAPLRGDLTDRNCPSRVILDHVSSRWGVLVLRTLLGGTRRFGELRREVDGVSEKMLAQTLQALERDGLVERRVYPVIPPHTDYRLTDLGLEAAGRVAELLDWVEERLSEVQRRQRRHDARQAATKGDTGATREVSPQA